MANKCQEIVKMKLLDEINKRKKYLREEYLLLEKRKDENDFLDQVYSDYKSYYAYIANEKKKQYEGLMKISNYLDGLIEESSIAKDKLEEMKNDKYKILGKIEEIRSEINELTRE